MLAINHYQDKDMQNDIITETLSYANRIFQVAITPKLIKIIGALTYPCFMFLFDIKQAQGLVAIFVLILIDFATGYGAAKMCGEPIRSSKIRHTVIKMITYYAMIASAHLVEIGLPTMIQYVDETVLAFLLVTEFVSLLENMGKMGYSTPQRLLNQLRDFKDNK